MKYCLLLALFLLGSAASFGQSSQVEPNARQFRSDGCSLFPDGNYVKCCVEHDRAYFYGGSGKLRRRADKQLYKCVKATKGWQNKVAAPIMWLGVRTFGVSFLPTPFRWGFGQSKRTLPK